MKQVLEAPKGAAVFLIRAAAAACAVLLGFCLIELTWNELVFDMEPLFVAENLLVLSLAFAVVFFLGQRTRGAVVVFLAVCLAMGVANHYVVEFRWDPVMPADLLALGTAADVAGGYSFAITRRIALSAALFALACFALVFVPPLKLTRRRVVANLVISAVLIGSLCWYLAEGDAEEDFGCEVVAWDTRASYEAQGSALCFFACVQDCIPAKPRGYDAGRVEELLAEGGVDAEGLAQVDAADLPTVIVVMNESFSDLSSFESVSDAARPASFYEVAADSLVSGVAYASNFGGGTCNSEFEALTVSSVGNMGELVFPYVMHDLEGNESLVTYFEALGYSTAAIHPEDPSNWRRSIVYPQLGFDAFYSAEDFAGADTLRGHVTDRETYELALDLVESEQGPLFVFDVTMQNHGGYETGLIKGDDAVSAPVAGADYASVNEYVSSLQRSDEDLAWFVEQLEAVGEPVVMLFVGDHQPKLTGVAEEKLYGFEAEGASLDQTMTRHKVPFLVWANYEAGTEGAAAHRETSLNYLGLELVRAANLPLSSYQALLAKTQETLPAVNRLGFMASDGTWYAFDDVEAGVVPADVASALGDYAMAQYANLFDQAAARGAFVR